MKGGAKCLFFFFFGKIIDTNAAKFRLEHFSFSTATVHTTKQAGGLKVCVKGTEKNDHVYYSGLHL